ncbi:hypothetical protein FB446DRAFT_840862 [Lentinula raphanica]|nr:hypothetical protein FB446DRAFT_840862 [Lentinula raphanica]
MIFHCARSLLHNCRCHFQVLINCTLPAALHTTAQTKAVEFLTPSVSSDPLSDAGPSIFTTSPPSMSALHPPTQTRSPIAQPFRLILVTSKSPSQTRSSPAPSALSTIPLTSSPTSNKESSNVTKERHPSPAPLLTSNVNIEGDRTIIDGWRSGNGQKQDEWAGI